MIPGGVGLIMIMIVIVIVIRHVVDVGQGEFRPRLGPVRLGKNVPLRVVQGEREDECEQSDAYAAGDAPLPHAA